LSVDPRAMALHTQEDLKGIIIEIGLKIMTATWRVIIDIYQKDPSFDITLPSNAIKIESMVPIS
jgi:hypothetical protein